MEEENQISKRVNDLLTIRYVEGGKQPQYSHQPTYTHQLFENELILLDIHSLQVTIELMIHVKDLQSSISIENASDKVKSDIMKQLTPFLTPEPMNTIFNSYQPIHSFEDQNEKYEFYLLTHHNEGATELLKRAEKIAIWYIETASSIDFEDDKWEVLYLIKRDSSNETFFIGYFTLYTFHNPFLGSKLRICQALILPPFHGRGYGQKMLSQVYEIAQSRNYVTEITVEDPAESFQNLRDIVDLQWYLSHPNATAAELKLIPSQIEFVQNAIEFHQIQQLLQGNDQEEPLDCESKKRSYDHIESTARDGNESNTCSSQSGSNGEVYRQKMKEFRLKNKRSLLQRNGDLKGLDKISMQKELSELYEALEKRYRRVMRHATKSIVSN